MSRVNYLRDRVADARANGRCVTCISRRAAGGRTRCRKCIDMARRRYDKARDGGLCGECRRYPAQPDRARCEHCAERARLHAQGIQTLQYVPLDEWLSRPMVRVMRALRRLGWASSIDVLEAINPCDHERETLKQSLYMLHRTGRAERRNGGTAYEYRLAPGVVAEPPNDLQVIEDDYARSNP